jgi:hypothetical protein
MRMKLFAAILASGSLVGLQAPAFAQGASGLIFTPNDAYANAQTATTPSGPFAQEPAGAFQSYNYHAGTRSEAVNPLGRVHVSPRRGEH